MSRPHPSNSRFFDIHPSPRDWSLHAYLTFQHPPSHRPRRVLEGWKKSLQSIYNCSRSKCCTREQRSRARDLLTRYEETGKGSDRQYGRTWFKERMKKRVPQSEAEPAPAAGAINIGVVYHGQVSGAPVSQTFNSAANSGSSKTDGLPDEQFDDETSTLHDLEDLDPLEDNEPEDDTCEEFSVVQTIFTDTFDSMSESRKWVLTSSGRVVETVIFEECQAMDADTFTKSIARSFVIDLSDAKMESWFSTDEWKEIQCAIMPLPEPDVVLVGSMRRFFLVKTADELQEALMTTNFLPKGVPYNRDAHFNSSWADLVVRKQLMLFEAPGEPLRASHLEDWYTSHLWSQIIDSCLLDLLGMTLERKEATCRATSFRKNRNRTKTGGPTNRLKIGPRLDGVIRSVEDDYYEYGGIEVARSFSGVTSTKWLSDSFKLAKALRDMLFRLHELVDHDATVVKRLQVVGVFNAGLSFQLIRMSNPDGYVSVLQREKLQQVPKTINDLPKLLHLLKCVAQMKQIVKDCAAAVNERNTGKTEADIYNELLDNTEREDRAKLGWAADTP